MPYELKWIVPHRVILTRFFGAATPTELNESDVNFKAVVDNDGVAPVYSLVDVRDIHFNLLTLKQMSDNAKLPRPEKLSISAVVTHSALIRFAASLIGQLLHAEVRLFNDYNEALDYLLNLDADLAQQHQQQASR